MMQRLEAVFELGTSLQYETTALFVEPSKYMSSDADRGEHDEMRKTVTDMSLIYRTSAKTASFNGNPVDSCLVLAVEADGAEIETVEGIASHGHLHPVQQCFLEGAALQCGVCTPGFIVAAKALLDENPHPTEEEIRFKLAGNLCRCTGYDKIVGAVQAAAKQMESAS